MTITIHQVYNGACINEPEAIVVVGDERDAAEAVKFVSEFSQTDDINLSVRSGGHSYGCTSSKVDFVIWMVLSIVLCSLMDYSWT